MGTTGKERPLLNLTLPFGLQQQNEARVGDLFLNHF